MIKVANSLVALTAFKQANKDESKNLLYSDPRVVGVGSSLLGGGLSAGLFHLIAKEKNKTLLNYLLAATAGAIPSGILGYQLRDGFNIAAQNPGNSPEDALPGAIADETGKAKDFKNS
jgi:hypothetical protein